MYQKGLGGLHSLYNGTALRTVLCACHRWFSLPLLKTVSVLRGSGPPIDRNGPASHWPSFMSGSKSRQPRLLL